MAGVSHLSMFYDTRMSVHVTDSNPTNNPNTELSTPPTSVEIIYEDSPDRFIDAENFDAPNGRGFETARFLINRALLDPDATIVPT